MSDPARGTPISRREFAASTAFVGASLLLRRAIAGPFSAGDGDAAAHPIPADKRFSADWLRSLTARGEPTWYRGDRGELAHIGMPIGGICAGQLYLGGDGKLWWWDLFHRPLASGQGNSSGPHYANPMQPRSPLEQGFALRARTPGDAASARVFPLDRRGFRDIRFRGAYPIGFVEFRDPECPVEVALEAFSPFIPLEAEDSGLPATVMQYTIRNPGTVPIEVAIGGWLENAACSKSGAGSRGRRLNLAHAELAATWMTLAAEAATAEPAPDPARPDLVVADFEGSDYAGWTASGTAFGARPRRRADIAGYQGDVGAVGEGLINTHETRAGEDVAAADAHLGRLSSPEFALERDFLVFRIGGGNHPGRTCLSLLVDGAPVLSATGRDSNRMRSESFDLRPFAGRRARIEISDGVAGAWGQIGIDHIVLTDRAPGGDPSLEQEPDFGALALALLGDGDCHAELLDLGPNAPTAALDALEHGVTPWAGAFPERAAGAVGRRLVLAPGAETTATFVVAWHFPNVDRSQLAFLDGAGELRRHYAERFAGVDDVVRHVAANFERLAGATRLWHRTFADSTLPHWFLERTFANTSTLATATCWRFAGGRFYGWEGTYCCAGTCEHVWQYAQAVARLFPALERDLRERVDFGLAFHEDTGAVDYRGEAGRHVAHDGLSGTIVRVWREHTMSADGAFLARVWPRVKQSLEWLMRQQGGETGMLTGAQYNTLDATWYGPMGWISSLYLAALAAGEAMASAEGDVDFAARCRALRERGAALVVRELFDGEYFVHRPDPAHPEANATGAGCHIDQVFGQSMAFQAGLGRILPERETRSALAALYRYSFAPDVGPYRARLDGTVRGGRWYAMPGEGGLLMCTWPKGGIERATGQGNEAWAAGYFNECMSGFEWQAASHLIAEGMPEEGLAIARMIHDRYHAARRNPWNEVECGDHYARAMASYGAFVAACGFTIDGPRGSLGFAPRISAEDFRAAFVAAEGWGTFAQARAGATQRVSLAVAHGRVRLTELALEALPGLSAARAALSVRGAPVECAVAIDGVRRVVRPIHAIDLEAGDRLDLELA